MSNLLVIKCGEKFWSAKNKVAVKLEEATFFSSKSSAEDALGFVPRNIQAEVGYLSFSPLDKSPPKVRVDISTQEIEDDKQDWSKLWEETIKKVFEESDVKPKKSVEESPKTKWPTPLHPYQVDHTKFVDVWKKGDTGLSYELWYNLNYPLTP